MKKTIALQDRHPRFTDGYLQCCGNMSWYDFVLGMPSLVFLVTSYKANGRENASLHSWASFCGSGPENFVCVLSKVNKHGHLYRTLKEKGVCVLNFPTQDVYPLCIRTIGHNGYDEDEITSAGLTAEPAETVDAPRIRGCFLNIECEVLWEHDLVPGSSEACVALRALSVSMDESHFDEKQLGRYGQTGYLFQIDQATHPLSGETAPINQAFVVPGGMVPWETR